MPKIIMNDVSNRATVSTSSEHIQRFLNCTISAGDVTSYCMCMCIERYFWQRNTSPKLRNILWRFIPKVVSWFKGTFTWRDLKAEMSAPGSLPYGCAKCAPLREQHATTSLDDGISSPEFHEGAIFLTEKHKSSALWKNPAHTLTLEASKQDIIIISTVAN